MSFERAEHTTGAAALDVDYTCPTNLRLVQYSYKLSSGASTSENLTIIKDAIAGAAYDVTIVTRDPSVDGETSYVKTFAVPIVFLKGDIIKVDWANTDTRTYGLELVLDVSR